MSMTSPEASQEALRKKGQANAKALQERVIKANQEKRARIAERVARVSAETPDYLRGTIAGGVYRKVREASARAQE
jgi:hypothetical protein